MCWCDLIDRPCSRPGGAAPSQKASGEWGVANGAGHSPWPRHSPFAIGHWPLFFTARNPCPPPRWHTIHPRCAHSTPADVRQTVDCPPRCRALQAPTTHASGRHRYMAEVKRTVERPLSPHLGIYRMTINMVMSIVHRITGGALYFGTLLLAAWLVAAAMGERAVRDGERPVRPPARPARAVRLHLGADLTTCWAACAT